VDECKPLDGGGGDGDVADGGEGGFALRVRGGGGHGRTVQVDPIKPTLKPPGTKRLKLKYDELLSSFAFNFNLRRCTMGSLFGGFGWGASEPESQEPYPQPKAKDNNDVDGGGGGDGGRTSYILLATSSNAM